MSDMARSIFAFVTLLTMVVAVTAQDGQQPAKKYDLKGCTPKIEKRRPLPKNLKLGAQKGEKATGYSPLISFQILESGTVTGAEVKRSSGLAEIDKYAMEWIRGTKFNARSGCGIIDTEAVVLIDWTSGE
jgi:TonB family protein